jgi:hypothetical protein
MTKLELKQMVGRTYLQRPELLTGSSTILEDALKLTHHEVQLRHNFRCMEASADLAFAEDSTDGADLPADFKVAREVWILGDDDELVAPMQPATEDEANLIHRAQYQQSATGGLAQRYYERAGKLHLLLPPSAALNVRLDYYAFLAFPGTDAATDAFLTRYYKLLAAGTAAEAAKFLGDTDRAMQFANDFAAALAVATLDDAKAKQGQSYDVYRPPLPVWGRR